MIFNSLVCCLFRGHYAPSCWSHSLQEHHVAHLLFPLENHCTEVPHWAQAKERKQEEREAAFRLAQKELVVPLMPEGFKGGVEIAASYSPQGTCVAPRGDGYVTVAIPLIQDPSK